MQFPTPLSYSRSLFLLFIAVVFYACGSKKSDEPEPNPITDTDLFAVTDVLPGANITGGLITIKGNKFGTDTSAIRIKFGGSKVTSPLTVTNTEITVHVPTYAVAGKIEVIKGTSTISSPANFSILPDNNNYAEYDRVTFTGTERLSTKRVAVAAAGAGDIIAFIGPADATSSLVSIVDIYNVITRRWKSFNKSFGRIYCAAAAGNKIAFAGKSDVFIYDVKTEEWTTAKLSVQRYGMAAAGAGNKIVFAGGREGAGYGEFYDVIDIYDVSNNTWSTAKLSKARYLMAGASAGSKILLAGGTNDSPLKTRVDIYDVITNRWTTSELSIGRETFSGAGAGNKVVFSGGTGYYTLVDYMDIYDVSTGLWEKTTVANDHSGEVSVAAGTKVLITTKGSKIRAYDVFTDTYQDLPGATGWLAGAGVKNKVIFNNIIGSYEVYTLSK